MFAADQQQQTPFLQPRPHIQEGYLTATAYRKQPVCGNVEGWGPLSPYRYDFTPCFLDVWIATVAVGGIVLGTGAIWYLLKRREPQAVKKNWHFYAKLVCGGMRELHGCSKRLTLS